MHSFYSRKRKQRWLSLLWVAGGRTLHGTLPWRNRDHETRRLLYRYSPKYLHMDGGTFETTQPEWVSELTETQRAVLEPPYVKAQERPELGDDGELTEESRKSIAASGWDGIGRNPTESHSNARL